MSPTAIRIKERIWVLAGCAGLTALAFHQDAGWISPDSKVDLTANPIGFLQRSMQLWEASGSFGQLQNQQYGYLWPMGPFYVLGELANLPDWVTQRLWWALLLCVAFTGAIVLAAKLHIGTWASRLIGGLAFALSARIVSELGAVSVEAWVSAVAPWVLVPLVGWRPGMSMRRPIALSALAVACAGGVNATAVFAVVPLAVLWLLSVESTNRRFIALAGWCFAVFLATAWWIGPLLLLGRYSPPFLDFIESASITTQVTDIQTNLRGASQWLAYLRDSAGPVWPAGYKLATDPLLIGATIAVAAIGLAGLSRRGMPHRRFLITGLVIGVALVGLGHVAQIGGAFPEWQRAFLDGIGAPLRNVHKFDVLIRLPLALGIAHLVGVFLRSAEVRPASDRHWLRAVAVSAGVMGAIGLVASPALSVGLAARDKYKEIPGYWHEASAWLDQNLGDNRVLVVPGSRFGTYYWGSTGDEALQALTTERWGVRNGIPLAPAGLIRYLDSIESALNTGAGSPGLADVLARSGVRYLLVRADVNYAKSGTTAPVILRQALARSPGITPVVQFGYQVGALKAPHVIDKGLAGPVPALEIFEVQREVQPAQVFDLESVKVLTGGPESLLDLASAGMLPAGPVVLAGDMPPQFPGTGAIITDGLRRREVSYGSMRDAASATMTEEQPLTRASATHDYLPAWGDDWLTVADYAGVESVTASSSWAGLPGVNGARPAHQPYAAIDGDPETSWRTQPLTPVAGQWLEIQLEQPLVVPELRLQVDLGATNRVTKATITTDHETVEYSGLSGSGAVKLTSPEPVTRIRITLREAIGQGLPLTSGSAGLAEVTIPGVLATRQLIVPPSLGSLPVSELVFTAAPRRMPCFTLDGRVACDPLLARDSEDGRVIARKFSLPGGGPYTAALWAQPRAGQALDDVLKTNIFISATASSALTRSPLTAPNAAIDGDPNTMWRPADSDKQPWLRFAWFGEKLVNGIKIALPEGAAASRPVYVQVIGDGGMRTGFLNAEGVFNFGVPIRTDEVTVSFLDNEDVSTLNHLGGREVLGVGVGELTLMNEPRLPANPAQIIDLPCGSGPTLYHGSQTWQTRLSATRQEFLEQREIPAILCGDTAGLPLALTQGDNHVALIGNDLAAPTRIALRSGPAPAAQATESQIVTWGRSKRALTVPAGPAARLLAVHENTNPGWQALLNGQLLSPVVVDGWQQGWIIPAGQGGTIVLSFAPERPFQIAMAAGAAGLLLVVVAVALPRKRRAAQVPGRHRFRREALYVFGGAALILVGGWATVLIAVISVLGFLFARWATGRMPAQDQPRVKRGARWLWLLPPVLFLLGSWPTGIPSYRYDQAWPQLAGLAAVITLWLSAYLPRRAAPRAAPAADWPLDEVPAERRDYETADHGHAK